MKNQTLFFVSIFSVILMAGLSSCVSKSGEKQPTDVCVEHKGVIEAMDKEIAELRLQVQNLEAQKKDCTDHAIHATGIKGFETADRNISYKILFIENIPTYNLDDSGTKTKIGTYTTALIRSEDKNEINVYLSQLYLDDENGNDAPKVKAGDIVWIEDIHIGEGTTETTLIKK